jgi:hypothetical protein
MEERLDREEVGNLAAHATFNFRTRQTQKQLNKLAGENGEENPKVNIKTKSQEEEARWKASYATTVHMNVW